MEESAFDIRFCECCGAPTNYLARLATLEAENERLRKAIKALGANLNDVFAPLRHIQNEDVLPEDLVRWKNYKKNADNKEDQNA